ncbi:hypothetical protein QA597_11155 [Marinilabiliaceae bacterium ANBcel2]|nr:hypothetical protein [Marinilabiliaceae bacterium ANBcel2]
MQNKILLSLILSLGLIFTSCDPEMDDSPSIGTPPSEEDLSFTVTQNPDDEFEYIFENTSTAEGLTPYWIVGGSRKTGNVVTHRFPMPGEYDIELTISNKGGSATITDQIETEETDWDFLASPEMVLLSGGLEADGGKTWVLDSLSWGHIGVGPAGSIGLEWWAAGALEKEGVEVLYPDQMVFDIIDLVFELHNDGESYVKDFRAEDDPAYSNPEERDSDYKVDFEPNPGNWDLSYDEESDTWYLTIIPSDGPLFPIFDVGAVDNRYEVLTLEENKLELVATDAYEGNAWHLKFIPEGYVLPVATFDVNVEDGAGENETLISLKDLEMPEGETFDNFKVDFGNENIKESTNPDAALSNIYMRAGTYAVTVTVNTSAGEFVESLSIDVENNHSDYEEFLIPGMVIYNNFTDIQMAPVEGEDCEVTIVDNPKREYPNRAATVAHYRKDGPPWANAFMHLPVGYRFDITERSTFRLLVYGEAGQEVLMNLENTDLAEPWLTNVEDIYTIQQDETWEIAEFDMSHADAEFKSNYYNVLRIFTGAGVEGEEFTLYFDQLEGPHVEGIKSAN